MPAGPRLLVTRLNVDDLGGYDVPVGQGQPDLDGEAMPNRLGYLRLAVRSGRGGDSGQRRGLCDPSFADNAVSAELAAEPRQRGGKLVDGGARQLGPGP